MRLVPQTNGDDLHHFYLQMNGAVVFKNAVIAFADQIEQTLRRHRLNRRCAVGVPIRPTSGY